MVVESPSSTSNDTIASMLAEIAGHLQQQGASEFRVTAYERAAETLRKLPEQVDVTYRRDGLAGVIAIPTIGHAIAHSIEQYLHTHQISLLQRLRGEDWSEHSADPRQIQLRFWDESKQHDLIPIDELLNIDEQYRRAASEGQLEVVSQVPVMSVQRGDRHYTVHFSNSPRAQQFHATEDWVVIERDDQREHTKWTVMTSHDGKLHGCRTVRGRDEECYEYYRAAAKKAVELYPMVWGQR